MTLTITTLLFDDFELLDVFGPLEMFGMARHLGKEIELHFVSEDGKPVKSSAGPVSMVERSFNDAFQTDILLVPGGLGTREQVNNPALLKWLEHKSKEVTWLTSVCTGSALLAKAGLLDGHQATTNKVAFDWVAGLNDKVDWQRSARWSESGNRMTSSGVSAGTDMALALLAKLFGTEFAEKTANMAEYEWNQDPDNDPFASEEK